MQRKVILLLLAAMSAVFLTAQPYNPSTLRECLEIGLENNYSVRIVRNDEQITDNNANLPGTRPIHCSSVDINLGPIPD